jgi:hypothetical protein
MSTIEIKTEQAVVAITERGCEAVVYTPITSIATITARGPQGSAGASGAAGASFSGSQFLNFPSIEALDSGDTGAILKWDGALFSPASGIIDAEILQPAQTLNEDVTLGNNRNGISVGPVTVASGVTITVPFGATWVVL